MSQRRQVGRTIAMITRCHDGQLLLCDELEAVADSLPFNVDRQRCLHLARAICPIMTSSHQVEEELLFDALEHLPNGLGDLPKTLKRLRYEHYEDACFAEELHAALLGLGRGETHLSADAVGYMLRGFFESVRRHVAFEQELLVPLLQAGRPNPGRNAHCAAP